MKYLFMLLFSLAIVTGVAAFNGEYEKSPPAPTEVVIAYNVDVVALATAEFTQDITKEAGSYLTFEAVIPYSELNFVAPVKQRVRWQHSSFYLTPINKTNEAKVTPTLRLNRSCLELNC